jgi:hypothetical protein
MSDDLYWSIFSLIVVFWSVFYLYRLLYWYFGIK